MKRSTRSVNILVVALVLVLTPQLLRADGDDQKKLSVTVSFGAGLNTAQPPGNPANHHVLPRTIDVKTGGVVNFVVAGFHQIFVYNPRTRASDIVVPAFPPNLFINDKTNLYYEGINPGNAVSPTGANAGSPPAAVNQDNSVNRVESVSFTQPGTYLVICNVTPHFLDGMYAYVRVTGKGGDNHH